MATVGKELQQRLDRMKQAKEFPARAREGRETADGAAPAQPAQAGNGIGPELQARLDKMRGAKQFPAPAQQAAGQASAGAVAGRQAARWTGQEALEHTRQARDRVRAELDGLRVPWDVSPYDQEEQEARQARAGELEKQLSALTKREDAFRIHADDEQFAQQRQTPEYQAAVDKALTKGDYYGQSVDSRKPRHRMVQQAMSYFQAMAEGDDAFAAAQLSGAEVALDRMNGEQRDRLAYYVGTGDYDRAADYLNRIAPELNRQAAEQTGQAVQQWAQEHPVQGALTNITSWPLNIPAYFDNARQGLENAVTGVDRASLWMSSYLGPKITAGTAQGTQEAARAAATETFGSEAAGEAAAFLTGTGLSIGQNATQALLLGPAALPAMAASAAGSETADALDRGATPGQAAQLGTASGLIEAATEKLPLENLFRLARTGGGKSAVKELVGQVLTEASEEMISEVAGNIMDAAVLGENSEFNRYIQELEAEGLSHEEAQRQALTQFYLVNVGLAGLGGGISGGVMGGGALAIGRLGGRGTQTAQSRADTAMDNAYRAMGEQGLFSPQARQAAQAAQAAVSVERGPIPGWITLPTAEETMGTPQEGAETAQERAADSGKGVIPPDPQEGVQGAQRAGEGQINAAPEGTAKWIVPFNQQEAKNLTSKKGIVAGHGISFRQFIDSAKQLGNTVRYYFGKTSNVLGAKIREATGHDVTGYNIAIRSDEVIHAMDSHGTESKERSRGQLPLTADVMERLPEVFESPDTVQALSGKDYAGRDAFEVRKQLDGYMVVVVGVSNGKHAIEVDAVYVINRNGPPATVDAAQDASPDHTSETSSRPAQAPGSTRSSEEGANPTSLAADSGAGAPASLPIDSVSQTGRDVNRKVAELAQVAQILREDYRAGRIDEAVFDGAMDMLLEEAQIQGLEQTRAMEALAAPDEETGGTDNGAGDQRVLDGDGGRLYGAGAGGEAGALGTGGPQGPADAGGAGAQRTALGEHLRLEAVSSRELGISKGTDARTVRVLPEEAWDGELRGIARRVLRETGLPIRFTLGPMEAVRRDGIVHRVRGVYSRDGAGIIVQVDGKISPGQIADHEIFHSYAQRDPGLLQAAEDAIVGRYSREEFNGVVEEYLKRLRGIIDVPESGAMNDPAYAQALADIKNEILADAFAGINVFGTEAARYQETVYQTVEGREREAPRSGETAQASDRRTGPPDEPYSIDYDTDNRPFVTVEEDILDGVPREDWVRTVKDSLRKKFPNGVTVGNSEIKINSQTRREMTMSEYSQWLSRNDEGTYADKFRAATSADEFLLASQNWINEGLRHPRKDNIRDFARGTVQLRIGANDYSAEVVVGTTGGGEMLLYDVVNLKPTQINERNGHTVQPNQSESRRSGTPVPKDSIAQPMADVKGQDGIMLPTVESEFLPRPNPQALADLKREQDRGGQERYSAEEIPDGLTLPTYKEISERRDEGAKRQAGTRGREALPAKARDYLNQVERRFTQEVGELLSVPKTARRDTLRGIVQDITEEYLNNGNVSQEIRNALFEKAYEQGVEIDREYYDSTKELRDYLRTTKIHVPQELWADLEAAGGDKFGDLRRKNFGRVKLSAKDGAAVEQVYQELSYSWPGMFDEQAVSHPADQLRQILETAQGLRMSEQRLDEHYGPDAEEFKRLTRRDFDEALARHMRELGLVKRYADERTEQARAKEAARGPMTQQELEQTHKSAKAAWLTWQKAAARNLMTGHDQIQVGRLLRGELELEHLDPAKDNVKGITEVYEAKREYEELASRLKTWNRTRKEALRAEADGYLADAVNWKDKKAGMLYSRETMERNIRDIVPDRVLADRINQRYFQPVHQAAAQANRMKNQYRDRVRGLELSRKARQGDQVSESYAVQLLGEAEDNIRVIEESRGRIEKRDGKTREEWQAAIRELWAKSPSLDQGKIRGAVEEFRAIYDELFQQMNKIRVRNGYEPVAYRQGYFPHFQEDGREGIMAQFGRALGIDTAVTALPTTINGLTHTFKPGIQWFGNALERKGIHTAYDAVQGFDRYIEGAADVICQTDNIQALRALGAQARYNTGDEGLRAQIDKARANETLSEEDREALVKKLQDEGKYTLNNFVVELDEYTNLLANKKSRADRTMEQSWGRRAYQIVKGLESRVAANMVAVNPASWLTNFVPLTQGWGSVGSRFMLEGMWDTLKAYKADDGLVDMSSFLTNRRGSDPIVKTWQQGTSAFLSTPMEWIDCFTADSLVRARFKQNQAAGLSEAASMEEADAWAAGVMADRSKGAMPTLFNRSNPFTKVFTQFQLEVNNQLSYLFKDMPREWKDKGLAAAAAMLMKFFIGAFLYNEVYEYFIGRRCALDPIGILNDTVGDFTGYELPNLVELGVGAATGELPSLETERKNPYEAAAGLAANAAEELPFIGGVLGGGRVPISSALPDWENLGKAILNPDWSGEKKLATAAKALSGPATYLTLPFGGGQVKKIWQGLKAVAEGGSYTVDNEGNDILQYPVFNETAEDNLLTLPTALTFGKSALPTAREWAERGYKSMGARQTACYQGMTELGVPQRDAYALLQAIGDVDAPTGEDVDATERAAYQKRKLLQEAEISAEGKGVVYYGLLASDKERTLMDGMEDKGEAARVLMELKDAGAEMKDKEMSAAKKEAIMGSSLNEAEKNEVFRYMLGEDSKGAAWADKLKEAGLSPERAAATANALNALTPEEGHKTVTDAQRWRAAVDEAGSVEHQQVALLTVMSDSARMRYEIAAQYGVTAEAWVRVKEALPQFDENGNGSYSGAEIKKAIDALAGSGELLTTWDGRPLSLSREEKAALWQMFTGNESGGGNPYSTRIGKQAGKELERAREEAKEE
ncbi:hypothetical protein [uncultured Oscillibacter sp.]|uniref:PBECR3 domain-containing polyvalent protein n=1 Tax=uncultured Oscillibacter sp. TaxID=876091 RepID=UPI0026025D60|nr:hypothetical protein [uncultured Oscillibacter sp.]